MLKSTPGEEDRDFLDDSTAPHRWIHDVAGNVNRGLKSSGLHEIAQRVIHIVAFRTNFVAQRRKTAEADCANCSSHSAMAVALPSA